MTERIPTDVKNLDQYGDDALPWIRARDALAEHPAGAGVPYFFGTATPDGRPPAAGGRAHFATRLRDFVEVCVTTR